MIYHKKPEGFLFKFEIVSCFIEVEREILLLLRQDNKPQPNTWGVPAGKRDPVEYCLLAILREIAEETGFRPLYSKVRFRKTVFVRYPEYDFVYHMYHLNLPQKIEVKINPVEHKSFVWVKPEQALLMPLIGGLDECIKLFYGL